MLLFWVKYLDLLQLLQASTKKNKQISNQEKTLQAQWETTTFQNSYFINFDEKKIINSYQV